MKLKILIFSTMISLGANIAVHAHEGHDRAPGAIKAPHGGHVTTGKEFAVELAQKGSDLKIYLYTDEMKALLPADFEMDGSATIPKKTPVNLGKFAEGADAFTTKFSVPEGTYRFVLAVNIKEKKAAKGNAEKKETLKLQVEPGE